MRKNGIVKYYYDNLGRGYISMKNEFGDDVLVFVHFSEINTKGYKTLNANEKVEFDLEIEGSSLRARNVTRESDLNESR